MQQLAQALELPMKAPSNDLRTMVEEKLRAMDKNPLNTQVIVDLQKEEGQRFCHCKIKNPSSSSLDDREPPQSSQEEAKEAVLQQPLAVDSEPVHEGRVTSTASDKELTWGFQ